MIMYMKDMYMKDVYIIWLKCEVKTNIIGFEYYSSKLQS